MLPLDVERCTGCVGKRGLPLPCCVFCLRRIAPTDAKVYWRNYIPDRVNGQWVCSAQRLDPDE